MKIDTRILAALTCGAALVFILTAAPPHVRAQSPAVSMTPLGYCQLTSIDASTLISSCSGFLAAANVAVIKAEAQAIRWRDDGTAPTATVGVPMAVTDAPYLYTGTLSAVRVISQTAGAKLDIAFYKAAQ